MKKIANWCSLNNRFANCRKWFSEIETVFTVLHVTVFTFSSAAVLQLSALYEVFFLENPLPHIATEMRKRKCKVSGSDNYISAET